MKHFFETVFYYCYLSYKKHDGGPEMRAISTMTMSGSVFIVMLIFTIYIFFKINITENFIYMLILFLPFPIINFIFYRMLYAKGKYKEIIEKKPKFCNNPKINKRIAWGYIWGISILGILLTSTWDTLKKLN